MQRSARSKKLSFDKSCQRCGGCNKFSGRGHPNQGNALKSTINRHRNYAHSCVHCTSVHFRSLSNCVSANRRVAKIGHILLAFVYVIAYITNTLKIKFRNVIFVFSAYMWRWIAPNVSYFSIANMPTSRDFWILRIKERYVECLTPAKGIRVLNIQGGPKKVSHYQ